MNVQEHVRKNFYSLHLVNNALVIRGRNREVPFIEDTELSSYDENFMQAHTTNTTWSGHSELGWGLCDYQPRAFICLGQDPVSLDTKNAFETHLARLKLTDSGLVENNQELDQRPHHKWQLDNDTARCCIEIELTIRQDCDAGESTQSVTAGQSPPISSPRVSSSLSSPTGPTPQFPSRGVSPMFPPHSTRASGDQDSSAARSLGPSSPMHQTPSHRLSPSGQSATADRPHSTPSPRATTGTANSPDTSPGRFNSNGGQVEGRAVTRSLNESEPLHADARKKTRPVLDRAAKGARPMPFSEHEQATPKRGKKCKREYAHNKRAKQRPSAELPPSATSDEGAAAAGFEIDADGAHLPEDRSGSRLRSMEQMYGDHAICKI